MCNNTDDKKFMISFEVGFIGDDFNDKLIDVILESLKLDIKNALDKNMSCCSNLICSKNIKCVELDSSVLDDVGGD